MHSTLRSPKGLSNIALWGLQALMCAAFIGFGVPKLVRPIPELATMMSFVNEVPPFLVRFIGLAEVLGGLGVLLPAWTRVAPGLTPLAAWGLTLTMALATLWNLMQGRDTHALPSLILGSSVATIAWGRRRI